ncbi:MAG: hypothetical protein FIB05_06400 [Betaproteobacteria bacterium]|nr:hypothetical protein [Betaproteobacteria bacterium]PWB67492.1 MAG: hypothetical protein C3F16_00025 [Betaproteobacteria bacterium]
MTSARDVAAGVAALACAAALAQGTDAPERRAVEQKEALVRRLVFDSPAEQRIAASGNEKAIAELGRARAQHARAKALAEVGDYVGAQVELDAAMGSIGRARSLAPDAAARAAGLRARYSELQRTVDTLARSYEAHAARLQGTGAGMAAQARLAAARAAQEEARGLAATEHLDGAVRTLEKAERELMAGLNATLGATTIHYAKSFADAREEYDHERARNRSYRELVPVAVAQLKPRREAVALIDRYVAANARSVESAEAHAAAGRLPEAADALRAGTNQLQAALAAAGLAVPRDIGAN